MVSTTRGLALSPFLPWLRQRHADIAAASYSARASLGNVSEPELGQGSWHASHDAYMGFTSWKREKLFFECMEMGAALSREVTNIELN